MMCWESKKGRTKKTLFMRNTIARQILEETPAETRQFVRRYGELVVRIHELLEQKGWSQKDLANRLGKSPSEISKWLSGDHNFTLRSLANAIASISYSTARGIIVSRFQGTALCDFILPVISPNDLLGAFLLNRPTVHQSSSFARRVSAAHHPEQNL